MINIFKPYVSSKVYPLVSDVLNSGYLTQGNSVDALEDILSVRMNLPSKPITVNSGTSALDLAYELIGIGHGDYIISTPQTCFATNSPLINRGAIILWADVDADGLIDIGSCRELVKNYDVKAIVSVDWAGRLPDYEQLKSIGVPVVEDAAHRWDNDLTSRARGDYVCYSFQAIKFLTCGDGGLLVAPEEKVVMGRLLRWYGLDRDNNLDFRSTQDIKHAGFKYHMNNINAAIGIGNIDTISDRVGAHQNNAKNIISAIDGLQNISGNFDEYCSYWMLPLKVSGGNRDKFIEYLKSYNIEANTVHSRNDKYSACSGMPSRILPGLDKFNLEQVNISCGWWLTEDDISHIIKSIIEIDGIISGGE